MNADDGLLGVLERRPDVMACLTFPPASWFTPDGKGWAPQDVLRGWGALVSDRWACTLISQWVLSKRVTVWHIDLPEPLRSGSPDEPAWRYVAAMGINPSPDDVEPDAWLGRADLIVEFPEPPNMLVEFGTCHPAKFALNLGSCYRCDWMIVPFHCPYAFVFRAHDVLLKMPEVEDTEEI